MHATSIVPKQSKQGGETKEEIKGIRRKKRRTSKIRAMQRKKDEEGRCLEKQEGKDQTDGDAQ